MISEARKAEIEAMPFPDRVSALSAVQEEFDNLGPDDEDLYRTGYSMERAMQMTAESVVLGEEIAYLEELLLGPERKVEIDAMTNRQLLEEHEKLKQYLGRIGPCEEELSNGRLDGTKDWPEAERDHYESVTYDNWAMEATQVEFEIAYIARRSLRISTGREAVAGETGAKNV